MLSGTDSPRREGAIDAARRADASGGRAAARGPRLEVARSGRPVERGRPAGVTLRGVPAEENEVPQERRVAVPRSLRGALMFAPARPRVRPRVRAAREAPPLPSLNGSGLRGEVEGGGAPASRPFGTAS